jgi:hypothetical protein
VVGKTSLVVFAVVDGLAVTSLIHQDQHLAAMGLIAAPVLGSAVAAALYWSDRP